MQEKNLNDGAREWLHSLEVTHKTLTAYATDLRRFIVSCRNWPNVDQVDDWYNLMIATRKPNSVKRAVKVVKMFMRWATEVGYTDIDAAAHLVSPKKKLKSMSEKDIDRVINYKPEELEDKRNRICALLALGAGLKPTEISGLSWSKVDFRGEVGFLYVAKGVLASRWLTKALREWKEDWPDTISTDSMPLVILQDGRQASPHDISMWIIEHLRSAGVRGSSNALRDSYFSEQTK